MFNPQFHISSDILENIKRIESIKTELKGRKFSKIVLTEMLRETREVSTYASTSIEGNPLPLTEVKRILKTNPKNMRDTEREVINYNQALEYLAGGNREFSNKLILKIHKIVMDGLLVGFKQGEYRNEPVVVNNPKTGQVMYLPPDAGDVNSLMDDLVVFVQENPQSIDPILLAGIFHKQFVAIHPFIDGNGRTVRLATKSVLAKEGLDTFNLFSFENYYNKNVSKYFNKVGLQGNYYTLRNKVDFTDWLEYFTGGIVDEMLRVKDLLESSSNRIEFNPKHRLQKHHKTILSLIDKNGFTTDPDYAKKTDRAKATRILDFNKLIELGLIKREGKGKNTYYIRK